MGKFSAYKVNLKGFRGGEETYEYVLENGYFADIDNEDLRKGKVAVSLTVCRKGDIFTLRFYLRGWVKMPCDRCLDDVEVPVENRTQLMVKLGKEYTEESEEIVVVPEEEGMINVAWYLYEFIVLSLPMKHIHAAGKCNREMTKQLREHSTGGEEEEEGGLGVFDMESVEEG
ncbi:MAG: DUF177 domain-containing protein [Tannerellaceae bacterium]|jgi:uncharacterized metal-binding protein YceD (DUF177 family)|nr:DUF177 domain-containing protein [Tannerellaceae bacterium]